LTADVAGRAGDRAPAVAQRPLAPLGYLVVAEVVEFPLVLGVCGPPVQLDDETPAPVADVPVPAVTAPPLREIARPLDVSDVAALERRGDPLAGCTQQVSNQSPPP
jgi:hypothetical protein